jgi:hypothetical protein
MSMKPINSAPITASPVAIPKTLSTSFTAVGNLRIDDWSGFCPFGAFGFMKNKARNESDYWHALYRQRLRQMTLGFNFFYGCKS